MSQKTQGKKPKVVDFGAGPHLYGGEFLGAMFDGSCVTIHIGNLEARITELDGQLQAPVVVHSGKITLSPKAATQLVNSLTRMISTLSSSQKQGSPVMN